MHHPRATAHSECASCVRVPKRVHAGGSPRSADPVWVPACARTELCRAVAGRSRGMGAVARWMRVPGMREFLECRLKEGLWNGGGRC